MNVSFFTTHDVKLEIEIINLLENGLPKFQYNSNESWSFFVFCPHQEVGRDPGDSSSQ